jgi:iron complex outermembrane receptor protein
MLKSTLFFALLFIYSLTTMAQQGTITGDVKTADGQPAPFVDITLQPGNSSTAADRQGHYQIHHIKPGKYTVVASFTGLKTQFQEVEVTSDQTVTANFSLKEDNHILQEVTVSSGYNKFAKKETDNIARMPLKNLENPQVYNVVPKELLQDQVIMSYNDVLKNVTGVSQSLVNGSNSWNLRGFSTSSYLRNGLQDYKGNSIEIANIERIEVLKGPSATLFGSTLTSFGGLVNRVTKKPYETFNGEVSYTIGGFGLSRVTADFNTPLNKEKDLLLRTNVAYHDEGSFQDAGFTKRFFIAPSLLYKVNDRFTITLDAEVYNQKANDFNRLFPQASFTKTNPRDLQVNWKRSYSTNDLYLTTPSVSLYGGATYRINDKWTSQTTFSHTNSSIQGYYSWNSILGDTAVNRNPGYEHVQYNYTEVQQNFNGDFRIGSLRNRVVAGLDYLTGITNSTTAVYYNFDQVMIAGHDPKYNQLTLPALQLALANLPFAKSRSQQSVYSAYVSDVLNITHNLLVMASLRVDHFVNAGNYNANLDTTTGKYNQTALSPKLGLVYQLLPQHLSVFGNYMNGFSNNAPVQQPDGKFSTFKPSHANQWETGVKLEFFNGKLNGTFSYYHIKVDDVIHASFDAAQPGYSVQDGGKLSKGYEAEIIANPVKGLNIIAGYAYNDIYTINTNVNLDGLHQWTGPAQMANLWISYHLFNTALKGLGVGIGGNYNGKAYITQSRAAGEFYLPSYTAVNAALSYERAVFRISLKMDNLTNEVYWGSYVSQMMPRRFSTTVAFKFK